VIELNARYYPAPFSRPVHGTKEGISATTRADLLKEWKTKYCPDGAVLSIAGKVSTPDVIRSINQHFGAWEGTAVKLPRITSMPPLPTDHIEYESAQLQIALAYPSAIYGDPDYYAAKVLGGVLSGGMFGRLFIEVREKRGLCYSVYARHNATKDYGTVTAYAGTTTERAQETLDVLVRELNRVRGTLEADELQRAKANIKSALVIGEESAGSRAASNAGDWWLDRKVRTLDEIQTAIDRVKAADIDRVCERFPATAYGLLTLGSKRLELPKL
jgi:predicted Zn-dependent peptidase